jgi:hypothetical protein
VMNHPRRLPRLSIRRLRVTRLKVQRSTFNFQPLAIFAVTIVYYNGLKEERHEY